MNRAKKTTNLAVPLNTNIVIQEQVNWEVDQPISLLVYQLNTSLLMPDFSDTQTYSEHPSKINTTIFKEEVVKNRDINTQHQIAGSTLGSAS